MKKLICTASLFVALAGCGYDMSHAIATSDLDSCQLGSAKPQVILPNPVIEDLPIGATFYEFGVYSDGDGRLFVSAHSVVSTAPISGYTRFVRVRGGVLIDCSTTPRIYEYKDPVYPIAVVGKVQP